MTKTSKPKVEKRPPGRPPEPVPKDKAEAVIQWISEGKTLRDWCRANQVHYCTVYLWLEKDKEFAQRFARARETGHDVIADQCFEIADEMPPVDANGKTDSGFVAWQKNRIWTRTQLLAKWSPQKYGDRTTVAGDPNAPLIPQLSDEERAAKLQAIINAARSRQKE